MPDTHTYTHSYPPLILRVHEHTHLVHTFTALPGVLRWHTHTHTSSCLLEIWLMMTHIHTPIPISTLHCLHRHIFFLHVNRSVSLACMRRYMQLAYLFHKYAKSLLSTDGRIADCTVRHPGVERPFSSFIRLLEFFFQRNKLFLLLYKMFHGCYA